MKGLVVAGLSVLVIAMLLQVPYGNAWNTGDTWGYKWELDWSKAMEKMGENMSFKGSVDGKLAFAYLVKYMGEKDGAYRFHFEGSYYGYGYAKGSVEAKNTGSSMYLQNASLDMEIKMLWINYDGYFDLVKVNKSEIGSSYSYYGIKDISMHVYTKKPLDIYGNLSLVNFEYGNLSSKMSIVTKLTGTIDVGANLMFSDPIPYIPDNSTPKYVFSDPTLNYNGHWNVNTKGYTKMHGESSMGTTDNKVNLDKNVNRDFNGTTDVYADMEKHGSTVKRTGIIENLPIYLTSILPGSSSSLNPNTNPNELSFDSYIGVSMMKDNEGNIGSNGFYSSVNMQGQGGGAEPAPKISGESQSASESEVKAVETNAPGEYGEYSGNLLGDLMLWIIIGVAVVVIIAIVVVVVKIKK